MRAPPPPPAPRPAAKNVILAGVRAVTVHDTRAVQLPHLSSQFYLAEADVGRNRAEACKDKLQELNTAVSVSASSAPLDAGFLKGFQVRASSRLRAHGRGEGQGRTHAALRCPRARTRHARTAVRTRACSRRTRAHARMRAWLRGCGAGGGAH